MHAGLGHGSKVTDPHQATTVTASRYNVQRLGQLVVVNAAGYHGYYMMAKVLLPLTLCNVNSAYSGYYDPQIASRYSQPDTDLSCRLPIFTVYSIM